MVESYYVLVGHYVSVIWHYDMEADVKTKHRAVVYLEGAYVHC